MKPDFAKAAELLIGNEPPITLAKVDCTEGGKGTCNKFSVSGYPTLKIFERNEVRSDYNGPREASGIVKYMKVIFYDIFITFVRSSSTISLCVMAIFVSVSSGTSIYRID